MIRRRQFLQLPLAVSTVAGVAPLVASAPSTHSPRDQILVKAGTDRDEKPFVFLDATFHVKISGKDTDGRCVVFDTFRPEKVGPPLHFHADCDEWFFVRDGDFKFQVGADIVRLTAGDSLLVPRNMPHTFVKTSEGVAHLIVMHQPAGTLEEFFPSGAPLWASLTPEARNALAAKHGVHHVGPALTAD